jgi:acetoin utilization protein AcuC
VHSREYVDAVKRLSAGGPTAPEAMRWGLGTDDTPVFPGMHEVTSLVVGGSLLAAELVMEGRARRLQHRRRAAPRAPRPRLGLLHLQRPGRRDRLDPRAHGARVLYIDYDAHHGDGVQGIFYDDPEVLTSPSTSRASTSSPAPASSTSWATGDGYGYSLNLPLEPFTEDDSWIALYASCCRRSRPRSART